MANWQTKSSKIVYENQWMFIREDQVVMPNGKDGLYGVVESKSNAVYVIPVDDEGNTYIVQQERYPNRNITWECVGGRTDDDAPTTAAKRELLEETGVQANSMTELTTIEVANGIATFKGIIYLATDLEKVSDNLDQDDGIIAARKLPLSEVKDMIMNGEITCVQSIAAFLMTIAYLERKKAV
jgi:8-oxo-dGTP pyrophosphatase MutT (NUDIX family)